MRLVRKLVRFLRRAALALLVVVVLGAAGLFAWMRTSLPALDGRLALAGIEGEVEILRDRNAVPHIRAGSLHDAYFALGFVHAQDRLFQMEFTRRLGAGRLSEVVGSATLGVDRIMRTLGLYRLARASLATLSPATRAALDAYAAGVNAFLARRDGAPPIEILALRLASWLRGAAGDGYTMEPWRPADSLVWARLMAFRLSGNWLEEALRARLAGRLKPARVEELLAPIEPEPPPTLAALPRPEMAPLFTALIRGLGGALPPLSASNAWVLSGRHTESGKPILANDPHLGFSVPDIWYLARIEAPGLSLTGATVPGVPFTVLGHNGRIAWGFTSTGSDTQDLFIERVDPQDPGKYRTPEGPVPFKTRRETIRVLGGADQEMVVRETRHGPVVSDIRGDVAAVAPEGRVIALAAAGLRADDATAEALRAIGFARDWRSFRDALRDWHAPQQNMVYADIDGHIGFIAPGRVPMRRAGNGQVPAVGETDAHDWVGFVPFDALPQAVDPPSGRFANANNRIVPKDYPYWLGDFAEPPFRIRRLNALLDAGPRFGIGETAAIQLDIVSEMARALAPRMLAALPPVDARLNAAADRLRGWDGAMDRSRPEPLIFTAWYAAFSRRLYADRLGGSPGGFFGDRPGLVLRALTRSPVWCDDAETRQREGCGELLAETLAEAVDWIEERYGSDPARWRWGDAHAARFRHRLFGWVPVLRDLFDLVLPADGGAATLNRGQYRLSDAREPFAAVHGAGYRAVYDLSDLDNSRFIQATGESGNPLSPHYGDFIRRWRDGAYIRIPARAAARDGALGVLTLEPAQP